MREICGEFFFQQGNVPAHRACETINLLKRDTCVRFTRLFAAQQHRSEANWLQKYGIINAAANVISLWCRWTEAAINWCLASFWAKRYRWCSYSLAQMSMRVNLCEKKTPWLFNLTSVMHMLFCLSCLLILWTLSKFYCVKCSKISQISVSYLSQGSAATHRRCDGKCHGFCCKFLGEYNSERILKIGQHLWKLWLNECIAAQFFGSLCRFSTPWIQQWTSQALWNLCWLVIFVTYSRPSNFCISFLSSKQAGYIMLCNGGWGWGWGYVQRSDVAEI